jgi:hypothetical protein
MRLTGVGALLTYKGWHTARHLDKYQPKYIYDVAKELLEAQKASGYIPHPTYVIK